mmetsp:Transcript_18881/g.21310  ORF Transcript_18881/g.21310 Transcript_18881/m.21310 type:complete len:105 (-) Transcript_18881:791-1105(-)
MSKKLRLMVDIEETPDRYAFVDACKNLLSRDWDLQTVETLKFPLRAQIKKPFLAIAGWVDLCYQQELSLFWNDPDQHRIGEDKRIYQSIDRLDLLLTLSRLSWR